MNETAPQRRRQREASISTALRIKSIHYMKPFERLILFSSTPSLLFFPASFVLRRVVVSLVPHSHRHCDLIHWRSFISVAIPNIINSSIQRERKTHFIYAHFMPFCSYIRMSQRLKKTMNWQLCYLPLKSTSFVRLCICISEHTTALLRRQLKITCQSSKLQLQFVIEIIHLII